MHSLNQLRPTRAVLCRHSLTLAIAALVALTISCTSINSDPGTAAPVPTDTPVIPAIATATATPTAVAASPTPSSVSSPADSLFGLIPVPPERDLYELARRLILRREQPVPRFASPAPATLRKGDRFEWRVSRDSGNVTVIAEVRHITDHAYWIFQDGFTPDQGRIEQAAEQFEKEIWPGVSGTLGDIWNPGIDNDPRIVIFHGKLRAGVAGYFSGVDEYPVEIQPDSNQREAIYISSDSLTLGGTGYLSTIAHELQHAIHWAADPGEESWVNEGIAEVASRMAGFPPGSIDSFLSQPNTSLVQWEPEIFQASPNYGAAALFFEYISAHYGGDQTLRTIIENPEDGLASIDAVMRLMGFNKTAIELFADWVVANYVDDDSGNFSYPDRQINRPRTTFVSMPETLTDSVRPFGTNYYTLQEPGDETVMEFRGAPTGHIFPAEPHSGQSCWWSNAGDSIDTTLTRSVDLTHVDSARFEFWVWHAIEEDWDYAYVEVSTDNGSTWEIQATANTSSTNPNGTAFGPGLTGKTIGWVRAEVNLGRFTGSEILLRIEYITDDAIHDRGACFDDFSIPEIGWSDNTETADDWVSEGFALINDRVPANYLVQVIRDSDNDPATVERIDINSDGAARVTLQGPRKGEQIIVAISVVTPEISGSLEYAINFMTPS